MRRIRLVPPSRAVALGAFLTFALCLGIGFVAVSKVSDVVVYNASPSMPQGIYVRMQPPIVRHSIVTVRARDVALNYATARRFTDANDRFLKRVVALDGDVVCALGARVTINHTITLQRRTVETAGRALPTWSGCRRLNGQVFLIGDTADSFDGRYWGPVASDLIEGVWHRR
ncbi:MAG: S26 family signal peptidase [Caulobacteraceae bacterium]|nr:S26 family signal peptidase [Caulobacteraceae bacterium]